ncbi:hypothetical protein, variant 4 [Blastomyces gilchristii SLH14081]|uniref:Myb-like domain-containing protein n=1 Tax=Blastomyces gilchristii (strain SLH14081) TaxID=559298 RepID=A0A179UMM7_BLAGS|nr:uncharacterized protein BDBG_04640 [Blastomyces gilchristii SLH14081]XP_031578630.1 hypothetical protein, variant 1 [Blastomyces gilchristii SLH14081]XP_031578631.1 hypothetical protein, variant 2 [Blastomyces gilchristii SLH14081]XP_031578632.1 hypothetical protein, variant 3 [Blastomyces gilchristii SLH14081]XP_031578633.1 hypothetical protein, variant 4 [Blastomyces gilchristii SLH14081]OAT09072.1 hypothetical protein BDBG_04640 [Blastomyces gilchristii SLH14081]OAT09073.1 hypothetical 
MSSTIRSTSLPTDARSTTPLQLDRIGHRIQKHRKTASAGGGRAWTEEEETYLIRTRLHKMPYKHIAAHLRKTELACRLHYHQMSYGNRRRRTESMSSISSISPLPTTQEYPLEYKPSDNMYTAPSSPSPRSIMPSTASSVVDSPQQSRSHVPILPKPNTSTLPSVQSAPAANINSSLGLDTSIFHSQDNQSSSFDHPESIDTIRLRGLYDTHRDSFWSLIASDYSKKFSFPPIKLEEAFFHAIFNSYRGRGTSPPTPCPSPQDAIRELQMATDNAGFHAINRPYISAISELNNPINSRSPVEKCAVASLLTVERDVFAPKGIAST